MIEYQMDVPPPEPRANLKRFPFKEMPVGASFFTTELDSGRVGGFTGYHSKKGKKFSCRTVTENGVKGIRIWRIA